MQCPDCGLPVLVEHGAITAHLHPDTLQPCAGKAPKATPPSTAEQEHEPAPKTTHKQPAKKAPAKAPAKPATKTRKT
jgi:hypothetical protein